jgi:hypothetical protein
VVHADTIAAANLARSHEIRERLYQQALDGALKGAGAISEISALLQQECPSVIYHINQERVIGGRDLDTLLHHFELNINDPLEFLLAHCCPGRENKPKGLTENKGQSAGR